MIFYYWNFLRFGLLLAGFQFLFLHDIHEHTTNLAFTWALTGGVHVVLVISELLMAIRGREDDYVRRIHKALLGICLVCEIAAFVFRIKEYGHTFEWWFMCSLAIGLMLVTLATIWCRIQEGFNVRFFITEMRLWDAVLLLVLVHHMVMQYMDDHKVWHDWKFYPPLASLVFHLGLDYIGSHPLGEVAGIAVDAGVFLALVFDHKISAFEAFPVWRLFLVLLLLTHALVRYTFHGEKLKEDDTGFQALAKASQSVMFTPAESQSTGASARDSKHRSVAIHISDRF